MNTVLMLAGGVGARMGANIPKQFIEIKGKPIIAHTLEILEKNQNIDAVEIVLLCPADTNGLPGKYFLSL